MSTSFNIGELVRLAQALLEAKSSGRAFMLEDVHNITRAAYDQYPEDPVINQVAFAIEKMAEKAPIGATINQTELSSIYNSFVRLSANSKFREVLGHLLLDAPVVSSEKNQSYIKSHRHDALPESSLDTPVDKKVSDVVSTAFSNADMTKPFNYKTAERGAEFVAAELKALGFSPSVEIMGGNVNNIVYASNFETNKGLVTIAIPTEISNGRVLFPSTFVADDHLEELTAGNLNAFVLKKANAGDFSAPKTADVLNAIAIITGHAKTANDNEFAELQKAFGGEKEMDLAAPGLFVENKELSVSHPDIDTRQEVEMPKELAHLARDFENDVLEAASTFGLEAIRNGKEMIANELRAAGFKNAQVKFGNESANSVIYLAVLNTPRGKAEIEVPVEMKSVAGDKYVPLAPSYFACDGLIEDFTGPKLQRFAVSLQSPSSHVTVYSNAFSYMLLPELKEEILKAASENDYVACETALDEIKNRFAEDDFKNAVADYHFILTSKAKLAKREQCKCSKMIVNGNSIYPLCGHLMVPMHKVVTDEQGNCKLKTAIERERLNPTSEGGAAISSAKVFMS